MSPLTLFYIFLTALFTSLVMTPPVANLAIRFGSLDRPDKRKVHLVDTPRLGGIAIFCAFLFAILLFVDVDRQIKAFLAGAVVIFLTGLVDDIAGLSPRNKFFGEILAATVTVISGGLSITTLGDPLGLGTISLGYASVPFTIFAVVGVMNAINLIDGLDGLAAGTTAVACLAFALISWRLNNMQMQAVFVALLGAVAGFLHFNTFPARIFMGDSGSLFLGYCLGFFSVLLLNAPGFGVSPVAPLMILGVPVLDTLVVMGGRVMRGQPVTSPDKTHLHHRLLNLGVGHRFSVLLVYGLSYALAASALLLHGYCDVIQTSVLVLFCVLLYGTLKFMSSSEMAQQYTLLKSDITIREMETYRAIVGSSWYLLVIMKYLLLLLLGLVVFVTPGYPKPIAWSITLLTLCMSGLLISGSVWSSGLLRPVIYFSGLVSVFIVENYGRTTLIAGVELLWISHALFGALLVVVIVKMILRKRATHLMSSSFEYLILFIVVAVPLLPSSVANRYHLFSVVAKSVVVFVAYKLILMRRMRRNRKILAATLIALLALTMRFYLYS